MSQRMQMTKLQAAQAIVSQHGACYGVPCHDCPARFKHEQIGDVDVDPLVSNSALVSWLKAWIDRQVGSAA